MTTEEIMDDILAITSRTYNIEEYLANLKKKSKETKEMYTELKEADTHLYIALNALYDWESKIKK